MKAIETEFAGCRFRSRLEARWAVVFDRLGLRWSYEPGGYEVCAGWHEACWGCHDVECRHADREAHTTECEMVRYLPDFYLWDHDLWVEVKGKWTVRDITKITYASNDARGGLPLYPDGPAPDGDSRNRPRVLLLGDVPRQGADHWVTEFHKGTVYIDSCFNFDRGAWGTSCWQEPPASIRKHLNDVGGLWDDGPTWCDRQGVADYLNGTDHTPSSQRSLRIEHAYTAARSYRFEDTQLVDRDLLLRAVKGLGR